MDNFEGFGLSEALNKSLAKLNYTKPTPIQAQAIPIALEGHDVLGSAQTGTGKTAAFSIPLVEALINDTKACGLILTPTRELAKQVLEAVHELLGAKSPIKTAFIIGGAPMSKQNQELRQNPRIIVGTPGRINDHLERGTIKLDRTKFLVLDETDRMLDMGFGVQLDRIVKYLPKERQTLMFSATLPKAIIKVSDKYLKNPKRVSVGDTNVVAQNIKQEVVKIEQTEKYQELINQLYDRTGSVIVFIKTKHGADRMAKNLRRDGFTSEALHGDLKQNRRDKVMKNFHDQNFRILIATDIAARGLDVPHIEHVINYDLPQVAEDYIHRMGRTARAGATGSALSFVSNQDGRKWHAIEMLLNPELAKQGNKNEQGKPSRGKNRPLRRGKSNENRSNSYAGKKSGEKSSDKFKPRNKSNDRKFDKKGDGEQSSFKKKPYKKKFEGESKSDGSRKFDDKKGGSNKFAGKKPYAKKSNDDRSSGKSSDGSRPLKKKFGEDKEGGSFKGKKSFSKKKSFSNDSGNKPFSKPRSDSNKKFKKA